MTCKLFLLNRQISLSAPERRFGERNSRLPCPHLGIRQELTANQSSPFLSQSARFAHAGDGFITKGLSPIGLKFGKTRIKEGDQITLIDPITDIDLRPLDPPGKLRRQADLPPGGEVTAQAQGFSALCSDRTRHPDRGLGLSRRHQEKHQKKQTRSHDLRDT
jgi:hypothetical protein